MISKKCCDALSSSIHVWKASIESTTESLKTKPLLHLQTFWEHMSVFLYVFSSTTELWQDWDLWFNVIDQNHQISSRNYKGTFARADAIKENITAFNPEANTITDKSAMVIYNKNIVDLYLSSSYVLQFETMSMHATTSHGREQRVTRARSRSRARSSRYWIEHTRK